jgi:hypothetical protein
MHQPSALWAVFTLSEEVRFFFIKTDPGLLYRSRDDRSNRHGRMGGNMGGFQSSSRTVL